MEDGLSEADGEPLVGRRRLARRTWAFPGDTRERSEEAFPEDHVGNLIGDDKADGVEGINTRPTRESVPEEQWESEHPDGHEQSVDGIDRHTEESAHARAVVQF